MTEDLPWIEHGFFNPPRLPWVFLTESKLDGEFLALALKDQGIDPATMRDPRAAAFAPIQFRVPALQHRAQADPAWRTASFAPD